MAAARGPLRSYTQEFVDRAVEMAIEGRRAAGPARRSMRSVSRELGVPWPNLHRWVHTAHAQQVGSLRRGRVSAAGPAEAFAGSNATAHHLPDVAGQTGKSAEALSGENARLVHENAILKAALALIARDSALPALRSAQ